jgi:hypothetical protein
MDYKCSLCGNVVEDDLKVFVEHTESHIVDVIKEKHPDWIQDDGMCSKCLEYYKKQLKGGQTA